jgi:hypothetical protein
MKALLCHHANFPMGVVWHSWRCGFGQSTSFRPIVRVLQGLWLQRFDQSLF